MFSHKQRVLYDEGIAKKYNGLREGVYSVEGKDALESFTLKRLFAVLWLLDALKMRNVLGPYHCLFRMDSNVKSSAEVLQIIAKVSIMTDMTAFVSCCFLFFVVFI